MQRAARVAREDGWVGFENNRKASKRVAACARGGTIEEKRGEGDEEGREIGGKVREGEVVGEGTRNDR